MVERDEIKDSMTIIAVLHVVRRQFLRLTARARRRNTR